MCQAIASVDFTCLSSTITGYLYLGPAARLTFSANMTNLRELRILLVGKSGNGKSTVGNAILGSRRFSVGRGMSATTTTAKHETVYRKGFKIQVVDTPDVSNVGLTEQQKREEVDAWRRLTQPFPTAVVVVISCNVRYTKEEYDIYREIVRLWGDNSLQGCVVVAFTFGELQDRPIEEDLRTASPELHKVLADAGKRYVVFRKKALDTEAQVDRLINMVESGPATFPVSNRARLFQTLCVVVTFTGFLFVVTFCEGKRAWASLFGLVSLAAGLWAFLLNKKILR